MVTGRDVTGGGIYWLASYPKSGNTWFRTFLSNLLEDGERPVDINSLHTGHIASSREWLDEVLGFDTADLTEEEVDLLRPGVYDWTAGTGMEAEYRKTHDAWQILPDGRPLLGPQGTRGAVYLLRNPLDVVVSMASHNGTDIDTAITGMNNPGHALSKANRGIRPQVRQRIGTWSDHVTSWVDATGLACHVLRYEDMTDDAENAFAGAARFLGLSADPERISKAIGFSNFDTLARQEAEKGFRERPARSQRFFREGRSGAWRAHLTDQQVDRIVTAHAPLMRRFGYLRDDGTPV
ncbi:sulfotransferase domain-containing protein [Salibaculum sp.]|uniref:sulfotransferase domain-containing protein n=1 Tax=Salibaculum sp. TaxID=2855480 RepID=UPI002B4928E0|nr:sulfotransferase domain-containing protein [Salibaculum sp.]HKL69618.1 sulfotransferase domain-containing protein [Salibaculum sp.]